VPEPPLLGDPDALYMACPQEAAAELATWLSPGPVLELCCGVGGLTRELARAGHRVLAVDVDPVRLKTNQANLAALGLESRASYLCCDLRRPALRPPTGSPFFAATVLDPDWSSPGAPPDE
jgi:predicted RNA methylase